MPRPRTRDIKIKFSTGLNRTPVRTSFLPAQRYASAGNSDRNASVCPSVVRLSVCLSRAAIVSK